MSGLFSILNIGTRGMYTQQSAINVTSHNIANANTEGYSRQRAIIETTRPFGMPSLNSAAEPGQIGTGSQIEAIQRVRDNFLDYQVRVETSTQGQFQARDKFLSEVESIFNEPSDTGISSLVGKFFDSWQTLAGDPQSSNSRTLVVQQSAALADALNHAATQLSKLKENTQSVIKDDVFETNDILNQIDQLNKQIIGVKVAGQMPNDLMDKRDSLLDTLSTKFNITLDKKNFEGLEVKPVDLISGDPADNSSLIKAQNNTDIRRLSYIDSIVPQLDASGNKKIDPVSKNVIYDITYYKLGDKTNGMNAQTFTSIPLDDKEFTSLDETRVIWADKDGVAVKADGTKLTDTYNDFTKMVLFKPSAGELKGYVSVQTDIDGYMDQLNKVAKALAFSVNAVASGNKSAVGTGTIKGILPDGSIGDIPNKDYMPFFVNSDEAKYTTNGSKNILYDPNDLTNLNKVLAAEDNITAANISVNKQLIDDVMQIKTRFNDNLYATEDLNNEDGTNDGSRALAIAQLRDKLIKIQDINTGTTGITSRADLFDSTKGGNDIVKNANTIDFSSNQNGMKVDNYYKDMLDKLGVQESEAQRMVKNQEALLSSFQQTKESTSGVSIDEEMANLIQYQHAYQANAKIISTVDELLDVVINGLKK